MRDTLRRSVRTAAAGAGGWAQFVERLRDDGLLVRERYSERNPGQVAGYAVALPESVDPGGQPIYFGGGKLGRRPNSNSPATATRAAARSDFYAASGAH